MFTGIVTQVGKVKSLIKKKDWELCLSFIDNNIFISENKPIKLGSSISCSGICLTLKKINNIFLYFDVSHETASNTNFLNWKVGSFINLERSLTIGDEIGGHFVSGHIDGVAKINFIEQIEGSYKISFIIPETFTKFIAIKGSITIDGVSLTVNNIIKNTFEVNIVDHTWSNTNFYKFKVGYLANFEIDILSRYLERLSITN